MILPITNQSNNQIFYNKKSKPAVERVPMKNPGLNYDAEFLDFLQTTKEQNDNKNKLLLSGILSMIGCTCLLGLSFFASKGSSRKSSSDYIKTFSKGFENLKNDKNVPTLDTCKSINKKLKNFLQTQVNYAKVKPDDINKVGTPKPANRLLLYGPPGTGKSYFAKIYAKTLDAEYAEVKFSDFNSTWSGQHIEQLTNVFEEILAKAKTSPDKKFVVVFNEIDSITLPADALRNAGSGHSLFKLEERSVFLNYLDEIKEKAPNVTVIGTTNIVPKNNNLDGAAMSRFKNIIGIDYPEKECLYEALKANIEKMEAGSSFVNKNENKLKKLAENMSERNSSFRDLNKVIDSSKNYYLQDYIKDKKSEFKFKYLEDAFKDIDLTDGEITDSLK